MKYYALIITGGNSLICREFPTLEDVNIYQERNKEVHIAKIIKGEELCDK
jgi:hypothetical protein